MFVLNNLWYSDVRQSVHALFTNNLFINISLALKYFMLTIPYEKNNFRIGNNEKGKQIGKILYVNKSIFL